MLSQPSPESSSKSSPEVPVPRSALNVSGRVAHEFSHEFAHDFSQGSDHDASLSVASDQLTPQGRSEQLGLIWVVDDDPLVTQSLATLIELELPNPLQTFNSPKAALKQLNALLEAGFQLPELIISDFLMPGGMDGIAFLRQVREKLPESTCVLLTGYADKENAIAAINQAEIYRYIQKPWDNAVLLQTIHTGLERARLVSDLRTNIVALNEAKTELARYNEHLEQVVAMRTRQWHATFHELQTIVNQTADAIITLDARLNVLSVNPAAQQLLLRAYGPATKLDLAGMPANPGLPGGQGSKAPDFTGLPLGPAFGRFLGEVTSSAIPEHAFETLLGTLSIEASLSRTDDALLESLHSRTSAEKQTPDKTPSYIAIVRDISRRKEAERLRDDFVSTLTHDLRTPLLATIQTIGFMTQGVMGALNDEQQNVLAVMKDSHESLLKLVNTLLDVYRYESGKQRLILEPLAITPLAERVFNAIKPLAEAKFQTLAFDPHANTLEAKVLGDSAELRRLMTNLLGNAIKFTPEGGQITMTVCVPEPDWLEVSVRDNGPGIPAEDLPNLFGRFVQGTRAHRNSGSGLGLFLSQQIAKAHGGLLGASSTLGEGSCFWLRLPSGGL
ncbi:MAG: ATP-binding protein [Vampirovibrionales bacterium]|nr:ATP-binding protein [Vampirovibrionales bacterium]